MLDRTRRIVEHQGWLQLEPDSVFLHLAKWFTRARRGLLVPMELALHPRPVRIRRVTWRSGKRRDRVT